jgi:hypothetical protein|tara:strand:- start:921 stop:1124 length:204 start_codon:yes stop_codon:yes gene_type:complete
MEETLPVRRFMEICTGMIGWSPATFWNSTLHEIYPAIEGFMEFNGAKKEAPLQRSELNELMELYPDE